MKLKGSYTVEAAVVISLCFILFSAAIGVTYSVFRETVHYVSEKNEEFDAVGCFRKKEVVEELADKIFGE